MYGLTEYMMSISDEDRQIISQLMNETFMMRFLTIVVEEDDGLE